MTSEGQEGAARRWCLPALSVAALLAAAFAVLTAAVASGASGLLRIDQTVVLAVNAFVAAHAGLRGAAQLVSNVGSPVAVDVFVGIGVVALLLRRKAGLALALLLVRLVELGIETLVKNLVDRPRPQVPTVLAHASGASFPSGHTAGSAALVVALLVLVLPAVRGNRRPDDDFRARGVGAAALVALGALACLAVAASRVLLGVHYPSDVVGGLLLGTFCGLALAFRVPGPANLSRNDRRVAS
ncbi:MAG TPA: phosphatase PAP2 family protein [Pseudonocardia sp.]